MNAGRAGRCVVFHLLCLTAFAAGAQGVYSTRGQWVDDVTRPFDLSGLSGSYTVATMAYGACRRVCSSSLRVVEALHHLAEDRRLSLNFIVFGLDPSEDKPSDWAILRADLKLGFSNVQFLSGDPASVQRMATILGVHYWRYGEHTMHDFRIVLISPQGRILRALEHPDDGLQALLPAR